MATASPISPTRWACSGTVTAASRASWACCSRCPALDYFRDAAPQHTADEEESLFPRLRSAGALASLDALETDHQLSAAAHSEVDALGRAWLDAGSVSPEFARRMAGLLRQLADTYTRHIAVEDKEIFPTAGRVLSAEQLAAVGREMENRRTRTRTER